jgi:hypothetical protein
MWREAQVVSHIPMIVLHKQSSHVHASRKGHLVVNAKPIASRSQASNVPFFALRRRMHDAQGFTLIFPSNAKLSNYTSRNKAISGFRLI